MRTDEDGETEQAILLSIWDWCSWCAEVQSLWCPLLLSEAGRAEPNPEPAPPMLPVSILSLQGSQLRIWPLAEPFGVKLSKVAWKKSDQLKVLEILCLTYPSHAVESSVLSLVLTLDLSLVLRGPWISSRPWADWQTTQLLCKLWVNLEVQFGPGGRQPGKCAANKDSTKGPGKIKEGIPSPSKPYSSCWLLSCCPGSRQQACRSWG